MKFSILTLFPNLIKTYISESIIKRAIEKNKIKIEIINIRDYTKNVRKQVDDYQFGGGKGMVLMVEPVVNAINSCKTTDSIVILTSPQGKVLNHSIAHQFSIEADKHLIIVCGHYEGIDERILDYIDLEISIGDYVLTGGELASLVIVDSITRLVDGVIAKDSRINDSFVNNLLDHPVYTKPVDYNGKLVPEVLLSGHHLNIDNFRQQGRIKNTFLKRPDLLCEDLLTKEDLNYLKILKENTKGD